MPYILLAFIYNPVKTAVTYFVLVLYVVCAYVFLVTLESLSKPPNSILSWKLQSTYETMQMKAPAVKLMTVYAAAIAILWAIGFFSGVMIYVVTWGSFDDFMAVQDLLLPLLVASLGYFFVKPTLKNVEERFDFDSTNLSKMESKDSED